MTKGLDKQCDHHLDYCLAVQDADENYELIRCGKCGKKFYCSEIPVAQAVQEALAKQRAEIVEEYMEQIEIAWTIIANANEGNWDNATPEWKKAAEKWRDKYHKLLNKEDVK